jgi:hypothetical protein
MTGPRPALGFATAAPDQVARLNAYEQAHPQAAVSHDHVFGYWRAIITEPGGETTVVRYELPALLDRLEELADAGG